MTEKVWGKPESEDVRSRAWIFQSNPDLYNIDRALQELDVIHWQVPQYTAHVHPGDDVVIWRSGEEAGIVAVGKVLGSPRDTSASEKEAQYYTNYSEGEDPDRRRTTRVPIRVEPVECIPKPEVEAIDPLEEHRIVTAPMGTVFPLNTTQWQVLIERYPRLTSLTDLEVSTEAPAMPPVFSWSDRLKSVYPLPGGYEGYLDTLRTILQHVQEVRPDRTDLEVWIQKTFDVTSNSAKFQLNFLERISLLSADANAVELSLEGRMWLNEPDPGFLIALMHSRIRLVGELLALLDEPRAAHELLELANDRYGMGWKSKAQIERRRGWLESAGAVEADDQARLSLTQFGADLLDELDVEPPVQKPGTAGPQEEATGEMEELEDREKEDRAPDRLARADQLHQELKAAAYKSAAPDGFERLTTDAFDFLGFDSKWLGGSGKTDVLLVAELGPSEGYRVIVDCKTTGQGGIPDHQIDWVTLNDHRDTHNADLVALVGPAFQGSRVRERAERHGVALVDVETLGGLLRQHARIPLGLDSYRHLFEQTDGADGSAVIAELAEEADRRIRLAANIVRLIADKEGKEGPLGPRDLYWLLQHFSDDVGEQEVEEIEEIVRALAAPGIGVLRTSGDSYLTLGSRKTISARLEMLAGLIMEGDEGGSQEARDLARSIRMLPSHSGNRIRLPVTFFLPLGCPSNRRPVC